MPKYMTIRTKSDRISFQIALKTCLITLILSLLLALLMILGLSDGSDFIHSWIVIKELFG